MKLIDKSALVAEIERRLDELYNLLPDASKVENGTITISEACNTGKYTELESFRNYIDTLEVKEVDLEKNLTWEDIGTIDQLLWELSIEWSGKEDNEGYFKEVLKRFKAQKGEGV